MLEKFEFKHAAGLAKIISTDQKMNAFLSSKPLAEVSEKEFFETTSRWIEQKNSLTYAIICQTKAVGLISMIVKEASAEVGIWLASGYWRKGIGSAAMKEIFAVAKSLNIKTAAGNIQRDNTASVCMCKKLGASITVLDENKYRAEFLL